MSDYALYRLPERTEYHTVSGTAAELKDISQLEGRRGFVLAPFNIGGKEPLLVIEAGESEVSKVPEETASDHSNATGESHESGRPVIVREDGHRDSYHRDFGLFHSSIEEGEVGKIVLARQTDLTMSATVDAREVFFRACRMYPHQMIVLVSTEQSGTWLLATPEVLLESGTDSRSWRTMALAGTMTTPGPWSEKNRKEQRCVADYILDCLRRHASGVKASPQHTVPAARLFHIRTDFSFGVTADSDILSILADLHPTPAVCGMPKDKALGIILANESVDRKYYSGFCGPLDLDGATHLFVSLRCMQIDGTECRLYAGGGLLEESVEENEWKETEVKLKTMKDVL